MVDETRNLELHEMTSLPPWKPHTHIQFLLRHLPFHTFIPHNYSKIHCNVQRCNDLDHIYFISLDQQNVFVLCIIIYAFL